MSKSVCGGKRSLNLNPGHSENETGVDIDLLRTYSVLEEGVRPNGFD